MSGSITARPAARLRMRRLGVAALAAAGLSSVAVLAPTAPAGAATRTVCASGCDFTSIAAAAAAAVNGDLITVAAGTYVEPSIFLSQKNVTLQGAGSGTTIIDGQDATNFTTSGQISVTTATPAGANPGITISGFTIRNPGKVAAANQSYGLFLKSSRTLASPLTVSDLVVEGENPGGAVTNYPIYLSGGTTVTEPVATLDDITVTQARGNAIVMENWRNSVTVSNSTLPEAVAGAPAIASFNSDARAERNLGTYTVDGNTFLGTGVLFYSFGGTDQGTDSVVVTDNEFTQLTGGGTGVNLSNIGTVGFPTTATITGNRFTGDQASGTNRGITLNARANNPLGNVTIGNNSITGLNQAIGVSGTPVGTVTATGNRLSGNSNGVGNTSATGVVNAGQNWWGCNAGPGNALCSTVTGSGTTDVPNRVVASASADDVSVASGGTTDVHTALDTLNDGSPFVPGSAFTGTPVALAAVGGSITPASGTIAVPAGTGPDGAYTAPTGPGTDTVTATIDGFPIKLSIGIDANTASGIAGVVTNEATGQPIPGIQVRLYSSTDGYVASAAATTNALGGYAFNKPAGSYKLWFRDVPGATYTSEYFDESTTLAGAAPVSVSTTKVTIDEQLAPKVVTPPTAKSTISGTVTAVVGGAPISGIQVRLYSATDGYTASAAATTAANGTYSFTNKAAGSYKLWFRDVVGTTWVSEYHSDKASLGTADVVALAGAPVTVNASLAAAGAPPTPTEPQTITGTITDEQTGQPLSGIQVRLYSASNGYASSAAATTDANGVYTFANKAPGTYKLWFRDVVGSTWVSEYHADAASLATATEVTVTTSTLTVDGALTPKHPVLDN